MADGPLQPLELMGGQCLVIGKIGHKGVLMHVGFLQTDVGQSGCPQPAGRWFLLAGGTQKSGAQLGIDQQVLTASLLDDTAAGHQKGFMGGRERSGGVLFHQQDGYAGTRQLVNDGKYLIGD